MTRKLRRSRLAYVLLAVLMLISGVWGTSSATAAPRPDIRTVRSQIHALQAQVSAAAEQYNASREKLKNVTVLAKASAARAQQQEKQVQAARRVLGRVAAETYKAGDLQAVSAFLADDPTATLATAGLHTSLSERKARAVANLLQAQKQLAADQAELTKQKADLSAQTQQLAATQKQIETKLAATKRLLASLSAAQRAALARADAADNETDLADAGVSVPADGNLDCGKVGIDAPNDRAARAIAFACAQLGEPYVWGGDGPNSWDCSGLTMRAWAQGGVSLPHNARMQAGYGQHVSVSNLRPGDLIYFNGYNHMGMYLGKGLMIHAPHTGDVVRIASARMGQIIDATRV